MDSVTQIVLGAGVAEAALGRKVGNKAMFWGAVAGTIPDLDVLVVPFVDPISSIDMHRGFSHSILFCMLVAPVLGYLIHRIHRGENASFKNWSWMAFMSLVTHPILDCFTGYGTGLLMPFWDHRIQFDTIFVIDPLYTLPFLVFVLMAMSYARNSAKRRKLNWLGIAVSTMYLGLTVLNRQYVSSIFDNSLNDQGIEYSKKYITPMAFTNFLWKSVASVDTGYWIGHYSLLDDDRQVQFYYIPRNERLLNEVMRKHTSIQKLIFLSKEYYCLTEENGEIQFHDLRFGRALGLKDGDSPYAFSYNINQEIRENYSEVIVYRSGHWKAFDWNLFSMLWNRIIGHK